MTGNSRVQRQRDGLNQDSELAPPKSAPTAPSAMRKASNTPYRSKTPDRPSSPPTGQAIIRRLGRSIGYEQVNWAAQDRRLVLADTLTSIEKLSSGRPVTRRPRELEQADVQAKLHALIPEDFFPRRNKADQKQLEGYYSATAELMVAASAYIDELNARKILLQRKEAATRKVRAENERLAAAAAVESALEKIEKWCDAWFDEKLKGDDWNSFEACLD